MNVGKWPSFFMFFFFFLVNCEWTNSMAELNYHYHFILFSFCCLSNYQFPHLFQSLFNSLKKKIYLIKYCFDYRPKLTYPSTVSCCAFRLNLFHTWFSFLYASSFWNLCDLFLHLTREYCRRPCDFESPPSLST